MYPIDILNQRHERFVLWVPRSSTSPVQPPLLVIGTTPGISGPFTEIGRFPLAPPDDKLGLWTLDPASISPPLQDGVYRYWFEIQDTSPETRGPLLVADPFAFTVDYSIAPPTGGDDARYQPASVIKFRDGKLRPCDLDGTEPQPAAPPDPATLPSNNHLVIYELPTSWAKVGADARGNDVDVGTFTDVLALFDPATDGRRFSSIAAVRDEAILTELGINALELLPAADAKAKGEWGYATAHYFATDYDLGSASDLRRLVDRIHSQGVRLFTDVVMAFGHDPYSYIDFDSFHLRPPLEPHNPDSYQSHAGGQMRDGYGGNSWRYVHSAASYDPETGDNNPSLHPAWSFHRCHLARWMADFAVGGLRLDSVNNVANYDFLRSYKDRAWELYHSRHGGAATSDPSKFLVIAEELSTPTSMIHSGVVNALWNEPFQARLRAAILGEAVHPDNLEWTVRKLASPILDTALEAPGFTTGTQAINYITSHDIEGFRKERLFNYLTRNNVWDVARRARLAFALLLTSVGIPMIFAGEEFADEMDRSVDMGLKQSDPVNYARRDDGGWRRDLFKYVARLVKCRTRCPALGEDETEFFHVDRSRGGRVMAWRRGAVGEGKWPVVVVVNLGGEDTPGEEYVVPNWPEREKSGWREVSQGREVPDEWVSREPLMAWEAKVYTRWREEV
ncbi:1,4-alpha-glucan branching enzyme GlgB [Staphylotrichum tortipilum]|uniref:1,4-alpha-glucan branching enzyme GlgB n=1 Tax=Staphylotrichum tortipilum TaxID=2831512 RepID=A0AAN6MHJ9_9PEZI|nr:1,4-alpha-glucan branching enzyme GlgB [Staphylotrichum longicolle]